MAGGRMGPQANSPGCSNLPSRSLETPGWTVAGFDDSAWTAAQTAKPPSATVKVCCSHPSRASLR